MNKATVVGWALTLASLTYDMQEPEGVGFWHLYRTQSAQLVSRASLHSCNPLFSTYLPIKLSSAEHSRSRAPPGRRYHFASIAAFASRYLRGLDKSGELSPPPASPACSPAVASLPAGPPLSQPAPAHPCSRPGSPRYPYVIHRLAGRQVPLTAAAAVVAAS
ncbi:hypothetical protein GGR56DRAFT_215418 [Xylariaceae sp. FL0804]|nr:hypothetical protein GGR56DRAFT_215418 [Xylariaceae sp. FL0804]